MSDRFRPLTADRLVDWIADELEGAGSIFGVPRTLFFSPSPTHRFVLDLRGRRLDTPIGVAAGPHTQLAPNIVAAWLCGARVIELKTVQTLDRIEVSKPCIDIQDEGYNVEWSQELTVRQSFAEYLGAWVLIHALHAHLGMPGDAPGVLFDLSVGYDLAGIRRPNMHWYLEHMADAGDDLAGCIDAVGRRFPVVHELEIPARLADSVTLSTLHRCPPTEIGAIVEHLFEAWALHTAVKLNPTLLGFDAVRTILVDELGFDHVEPHRPSFDADIDYPAALALLDRLRTAGEGHGLDFSLKLCNTLPVVNRRPAFQGDHGTAYLSGRPLHALTVELARRLTRDTGGGLSISFAGGADAFNTPRLLAAGLRPVTACSDLLRPGGYLRLRQYLAEIDAAMDRVGARDLDGLILGTVGKGRTLTEAARRNLEEYADGLPADPALAKTTHRRDRTKTARTLGAFDCIAAPCTDACAVDQAVPAYMRRVAAGDVAGAAEVIARDNPLPSILGRACHHPCEPVCLRTHLDQPVAIREIKRHVTDHAPPFAPVIPETRNDLRVAVVGGGPCGLAAAADLARAGARVTVFEARHEGGGMVSATIPGYRAAREAVVRDLEAVARLGVEMVLGVRIGSAVGLDQLFGRGFSHIVVAAGAQRGLRLGLDGEDCAGVLDGLDFLREVRRGVANAPGLRVGIVGGGDVGMDCARSARRLTDGEIEILYRRTIAQMPAHPEEVRDLVAEGIRIRELVAPRRIIAEGGRLRALECATMVLGDADDSGRPRPVEAAGTGVTLELDSLIVAIGQRVDLGVFGDSPVECSPAGFVRVDPVTCETSIPRVYAGGDLIDPGPSSIVDACGDGRRIARAILEREGLAGPDPVSGAAPVFDPADLLGRRARRLPRVPTPHAGVDARRTFAEVVQTLESGAAVAEAKRCLDCDVLCSTCDGVCPNRAIVTYRLEPRRALLPTIRFGDDGVPHAVDPSRSFAIAQTPQVAVVADLCNECGNCVTFCPTAGKPWRDKPRLYLHRPDFEGENDNAFMLLRIDGEIAIQARFDGRLHQLRVVDDLVCYESPFFRASLRGKDFAILDLQASELGTAAAEQSLECCAIMYALLTGLTDSMPHLPVTDADPGWPITHRPTRREPVVE